MHTLKTVYNVLAGLALAGAVSCGEAPLLQGGSARSEQPTQNNITIEGKVYLTPSYTRSALTSSDGRVSSTLGETQTVLTEGQVEAYCGAAVRVGELSDKCRPGGEYISSATISRGGDYSVTVPRDVAETVGVGITAKDKDGNFIDEGLYVPNPTEQGELYPTPVVRQDITPETTVQAKLLYGTEQKIKEERGRFTYDDLTDALGIGAAFFAKVPNYFKDLAIMTVDEYFNKAESDTIHQQELGDAYKSKISGTAESTTVGADIIQRARRIDLGNGNFIEVTEVPRGRPYEEPNDEPEERPEQTCDLSGESYYNCFDNCFFGQECNMNPDGGMACADNCRIECCGQAGCAVQINAYNQHTCGF